MKNQHQHIKGYRDLSAEEIELMNAVKHQAEQVGQLVERLKTFQYESDGVPNAKADGRWIAIAQTQLQQGFMALTRAVAKPTTF